MLEWLLDTTLDALKEYVEPWIHPFKDNSAFWYFAFLVLLSIIVIAIYKREDIKENFLSDERREHDKALFKTLDEIMSESEVRDFVSTLKTYSMYYQYIIPKLQRMHHKAESVESTFLNPKINKQFKQFLQALGDLDMFITLQFFPVTNEAYKMQPEVLEKFEFGSDEHGNRWEELQSNLNALADKTIEAYTKYRIEVKKRLSV